MPDTDTWRVILAKPPEKCPACRIPLAMAYPQCPGCGEPLTPPGLKARADAAVDERGLGFPDLEQA